jgi:hypothetical protein
MSTRTIQPTSFAIERWMRMPLLLNTPPIPGLVATPPIGGDLVAFSGYADFTGTGPQIEGTGDVDTDPQETWLEYDAELVVGPHWRLLRGVSPIVVIGGHSQVSPDEAQAMGFKVQAITKISLIQTQGQLFSRIQLNVSVVVRGGVDGKVLSLAYYGTAWGYLFPTGVPTAPFGPEGVFFPGPPTEPADVT